VFRGEFRGTITALVTPFSAGGALDEKALRALVQRQVEAGVEAVVPLGTTGESPTLSPDERAQVFRAVVAETRGSETRVLAGTGSNHTRVAIARTREAREAGADGALVVAPAYNKPSQDGIFFHFRAVADAVAGFPLVLYNVPSRCGVNMSAQTTLRLAATPDICAIKEASGDLGQIMAILAGRPADFAVLSGDDALTFAILALGGDGVVSVASNVSPRKVRAMVDALADQRLEEARRRHFELLALARELFLEPSPGPAKGALAIMGMCENAVRLPLLPLSEDGRWRMRALLDALKPEDV
jgi:4-hydroxy-tetrahydrodipicolinate synthase